MQISVMRNCQEIQQHILTQNIEEIIPNRTPRFPCVAVIEYHWIKNGFKRKVCSKLMEYIENGTLKIDTTVRDEHLKMNSSQILHIKTCKFDKPKVLELLGRVEYDKIFSKYQNNRFSYLTRI